MPVKRFDRPTFGFLSREEILAVIGTPGTTWISQRDHLLLNLCPMLARRSISPHTIRHTPAMHLLQSGVDVSVIALWLGHENPTTTHMYVEANLAMKERALARLQEPKQARHYRPPDAMMRFLRAL